MMECSYLCSAFQNQLKRVIYLDSSNLILPVGIIFFTLSLWFITCKNILRIFYRAYVVWVAHAFCINQTLVGGEGRGSVVFVAIFGCYQHQSIFVYS